MAQTNNPEENRAKKKNNKTYVRVLAFYNKHFPTDKKTYSIRLPLTGLVFSILSLHTVLSLHEPDIFMRFQLVIYSYILIATGTAYELYWGFNIGDRKQYTPWIIQKIIEIILTFGLMVYGICSNQRFLERISVDIVFGFILLFLNTYITYTVIVKSFQIFRGDTETDHNRNDENLYDFPEEYRGLDNQV